MICYYLFLQSYVCDQKSGTFDAGFARFRDGNCNGIALMMRGGLLRFCARRGLLRPGIAAMTYHACSYWLAYWGRLASRCFSV